MGKEQPNTNIIATALWNAFPSVASFHDFKELDGEISRRSISRIIKYAYENNIIEEESEQAFIKFLAGNNRVDIDKPLPEDLTFSDVIEIISGKTSVNYLVIQLEEITKELALPKIKASMITRLKQHFILNTAKKRSLLRILAYRLAEKRPDLNWHYEMLRKITVGTIEKSDETREKAGVTISLHLQGKGEIIVPADVCWLRMELARCIEYLNLAGYVNKKTIISSGASSFSLKLPKKPGPAEQPRLYDRAIRDILAIAHQMSVRWLLSEYGSPQKKLVILIHAGLVSEAKLAIQPLLEVKLSAETGIYLTEFAYLCARFAEVKVGFERYKEGSNSDNTYTGDIWILKYFWSHNYYDYIPYLLEERMLPVSNANPSYRDFQMALYFPEQYAESRFEALLAMHRFPQNSLLLIEIAKVLRARQMPYEADMVLSNLLLSNPGNIAARVMRMIIYSNIAQAQTDLSIAEMAYERAIAEGEFISGLSCFDSVIWCEFGILHCNRAKKYIKHLRECNLLNGQIIGKEEVLNSLKKAKECFLKTAATSPTGKDTSAIFWILYTSCFIDLVASDENFLKKAESELILDNNNIFKKISLCLFKELGWLRDEAASGGNIAISKQALDNFSLTMTTVMVRMSNLMLIKSYIPYAKYLYALFILDFMPYFTLGMFKQIFNSLNEARIETEKLIKYNISVYRISQNFVTPDKFMLQIQETIDLLKQFITDYDLKKDDNTTLAPEKLKELSKIKLTLLELNWF